MTTGLPDLSLFVESGVGLAGFSAVVAAFWQREGALNDDVGWPWPHSFGPIAAGLVWYLFLATLMFLRLLLFRIGNRT